MENKDASDHEVPVHASSQAHELPARPLTIDEIIAACAVFTDEQRSLAWSPEPPFAGAGAHDCRMGGSCGLDFNRETPRARWRQARHRWSREQKELQDIPQRRG
jgi:hypothetical protein